MADVVSIAKVVASIAQSAASVYASVKGFFGGVSPRVSWEQANSIAEPTAKTLTNTIISQVDPAKIPVVVSLYSKKLSAYIASSAHSDPTTRQYFVGAIAREVPATAEFLVFTRADDAQLAYAIWLHAVWLYGNVSEDEIGASQNGLIKFTASLQPTLVAAVEEASGVTVSTTPTDNGSTKEKTVITASMFSGTTGIILAVLAVLGLIYFSARAK